MGLAFFISGKEGKEGEKGKEKKREGKQRKKGKRVTICKEKITSRKYIITL